MHLEVRRNALLDAVEEGAELNAAMMPLAGPDHRARLHVERGEQIDSAVRR